MYVPQLPTDNLYKFIALSGVALILVSFFYTDREMKNLSIKTIDTITKSEMMRVESEAIARDVKAAQEAKSSDLAYVRSLQQKTDLAAVKHVEIRGELKKQQTYLDQADDLIVQAILGMAIGLFMAISGFVFWYLRVQKPADSLLLQQLKQPDPERSESANEDQASSEGLAR